MWSESGLPLLPPWNAAINLARTRRSFTINVDRREAPCRCEAAAAFNPAWRNITRSVLVLQHHLDRVFPMLVDELIAARGIGKWDEGRQQAVQLQFSEPALDLLRTPRK